MENHNDNQLHHLFSGGKSHIFKLISYLFLILSLVFLGYKIYTFEEYDHFANAWSHISFERLMWMVFVLVLFPANWLTEAYKWRKATSHLENLKISTALKSVLAGTATGFVTPNKLGDIFGRLTLLKPESRKSGVSLLLVNSITQTLAIIFWGLPSTLLFIFLAKKGAHSSISSQIWTILAIFVLVVFLYFYLPKLMKQNKIKWIKPYMDSLSLYTRKDLFIILRFSILRMFLFSCQMYGLLHFFDVQLTVFEAFASIPANYLFVTFTPSIAISEAVVRSSYAVLFMGSFSDQSLPIALAGMMLWFINIVIPVIIGSVLMLLNRQKD